MEKLIGQISFIILHGISSDFEETMEKKTVEKNTMEKKSIVICYGFLRGQSKAVTGNY